MRNLHHQQFDVRSAPRGRAADSRFRAVTTLTLILAVMATGVLIASAVKFIRNGGLAHADSMAGADGTAPRAAHGKPRDLPKPYFSNVSVERGIDFIHECGARGNYYIPEEMGPGGAWFDYDDDGDMDLYLIQGGMLTEADDTFHNRLYRNDGPGGFTDVSEHAGADVAGYAADIDNDGDVDLYVTRVGPNALLINNGDGTFVESAANAGVDDPGFSTGAAFLDYDRDGFLDLYVTTYLEWSPQIELPCYSASGVRDYCNPVDYKAPSEDRLYRNLGNGTFQNASESAGIKGALGHGLGVLAEDFNRDGFIDIYVANDQNPAFLWVNKGDGTFEDNAAWAGCAFNSDGIAIAGMGVVSEDLDDDEDFDLIVTNIHDQAHLALENVSDSGKTCSFVDRSRRWGLGGWGVPYTGFGIALFDRNADGTFEGIVTNGAVNVQLESHRKGAPYAEPNQYIQRNDDDRFEEEKEISGFPAGPTEMSRGVLVADFDNDGDVDFAVTNNRGPTELWRNDYAGENHWIMLDIFGNGGNRHALNALVEIKAGGKRMRRRVRPHAGYLTSNDPRVFFGLGNAADVKRVSVTYSDGTSASWNDLKANRIWKLRNGKPAEAQNDK